MAMPMRLPDVLPRRANSTSSAATVPQPAPHPAALVQKCARRPDSAFASLEVAFKSREFELVNLKVDTRFAPLRDDPRLREPHQADGAAAPMTTPAIFFVLLFRRFRGRARICETPARGGSGSVVRSKRASRRRCMGCLDTKTDQGVRAVVPIISANTNAKKKATSASNGNSLWTARIRWPTTDVLRPCAARRCQRDRYARAEKFRERQWSKLSDDAAITVFAGESPNFMAGGAPWPKCPKHRTRGLSLANAPTKTRHLCAPDCCLAIFKSECQSGRRILRRWHHRGNHQCAGADRGLKVAARTSCFVFKEKRDLRVVAENLGSTMCWRAACAKPAPGCGSRRSSSTLRTAAIIGRERYDRELTDVFAILG